MSTYDEFEETVATAAASNGDQPGHDRDDGDPHDDGVRDRHDGGGRHDEDDVHEGGVGRDDRHDGDVRDDREGHDRGAAGDEAGRLADLRRFVELIWSPGWHALGVQHAGDGHVYRHVGTYETPEAWIDKAKTYVLGTYHVWIGVNAMAVQPPARGGNLDVTSSRVLSMDLDFDAPPGAHEATDLPTEAEVRHALAALGSELAPNLVVHSGWGLQPHWTLAIDVTPEVRQGQLHALADRLKIPVDRLDLAAMLRVPGSRNFKIDPTKTVVVERWPTGPGFTPEYLAKRCKPIEAPPLGKGTRHIAGPITDDQRALLALLEERHGAHSAWPTRDGQIRVTRPNKRYGTSGSIITGQQGDALATIFSSGWTPIGPSAEEARRQQYRSWILGVDGELHHPGDVTAKVTYNNTPPPDADTETGEINTPVMNLEDTFWSERTKLKHIRKAAWSRMVSPDALLANAIARTATLILPAYRLPPVIGNEATLDYIAAVIADTSGGKSIAHGVAMALIPCPDWEPEDENPVMMDLPIGSGEGIAEAFMVDEMAPNDKGKLVKTGKRIVDRQALHLVVDEGTAFVNQADRKGTTVVGTLASAWSGQALGNLNASKETRRLIKGGRVRVTAVINMQAENGHLLFKPEFESVGLTGRILFASAHDPAAPADDLPEWPGELVWPTLPAEVQQAGRFTYDAAIEAEIRATRHAVLTRRRAIVRRQSQTLLLRCKTAAVLAYWEGRLNITIDDWRLAGQIIAMSTAVLGHVEKIKQTHDAVEGERRAMARGDADAISETARERRLIADLSTRIDVRVPDEGIGQGQLERLLTSKATRHRFRPALDLAIANGYVDVVDGRVAKVRT